MMDFALSAEQQLLQESLERFFTERCDVSRVRALLEQGRAGSAALWRELAELGVAGVLVPARCGGAEQRMLDAVVASQCLGWGLAPVPSLGSAVMGPVALSAAQGVDGADEWLRALAAGARRLGVAVGHVVAPGPGARLTVEGDRLRGTTPMVIDAAGADGFVVAVEQSLALVDAGAAGLRVEPMATIDRTRSFAQLHFDAVEPSAWLPGVLARTLTAGRLALAADTLGACERALSMAVEYAQQRQQFGRPIGSFQAVKHMCADMLAALEPARALLWYAAHAFDEAPPEAERMALHAKAHLSEVGQDIVRAATEVHGGAGFTDRQNLHLWFKRVGVDRPLLGTPTALRQRAARLDTRAAP